VIIWQPEDAWVLIGEPIHLDVIATNYVTVRWERWWGDSWIILTGAETPVIEFTAQTVEDSGQYRAVLFGNGGTVAMTAPATVSVGRILRAGDTNSQFTLKVPPGSGPVFSIEGSTDLRQWNRVLEVTNAGTAIDLGESESARNSRTRYYRARDVDSGQVVSENIAGFLDIELVPGFSMIGFPLVTPDNTVAGLFKGLPETTTVYKYYTDGRGFNVNTFAFGEWLEPQEQIKPGEGVLTINPSDDIYLLGVRGDVATGSFSQQIPAKWSLQTPQLPLSGRLDMDLGCPMSQLDIVAKWKARQGTLDIYIYADGGWLGGAPVIEPGEAFWIWKTNAVNWSGTFSPVP
jgi:hypothetical protein